MLCSRFDRRRHAHTSASSMCAYVTLNVVAYDSSLLQIESPILYFRIRKTVKRKNCAGAKGTLLALNKVDALFPHKKRARHFLYRPHVVLNRCVDDSHKTFRTLKRLAELR